MRPPKILRSGYWGPVVRYLPHKTSVYSCKEIAQVNSDEIFSKISTSRVSIIAFARTPGVLLLIAASESQLGSNKSSGGAGGHGSTGFDGNLRSCLRDRVVLGRCKASKRWSVRGFEVHCAARRSARCASVDA